MSADGAATTHLHVDKETEGNNTSGVVTATPSVELAYTHDIDNVASDTPMIDMDDDEKLEVPQSSNHMPQQSIHEDSEDSKQYYKLDDFELEYNVKRMRERFDKLVSEYSDFEEDIYTVSERELMDILGNLAIDSYGILLWILCMDQLETERKKIIWDILIFLAMRMPTQCAMDLLMHYSSSMARYSPHDVSELGKSLVHGSQFPLATCLVLSAFFVDAASKDLTRDEQLRKLSREYAVRATAILDEVENDYLAVIMLETPSFHSGRSPLEIALENDIIDFLACNKVSRISNAMWTLPNVMSIGADTASAFALSDFSASDIHCALLEDSYSFYFSSMGYFTVEVVTYLLYLGLFTYLTHLRRPVDEAPSWLDYIFWVGNVGFVLGEIIELGYDGWREYLAKWQNWLDVTISVNFILIILIRTLVTIFGDLCGDICREGFVALIYKVIWALNIVILWLRLLHFMLLSRAVGPLITNIKNMLKDIASFGKMYILILMGFVFALYFLIGGEGRNILFTSVDKSILNLVKTTLGQLEWECVRDLELEMATHNTTGVNAADLECQCDYEGGCDYLAETGESRADIATILLLLFCLLTLVVLFNLLTAMMATTYRLITERSDKEVLSRKVALGVEYDKQNQVMPPPFNMLVLVLFVIYSVVDALLLLFTQKFISESYGKKQWKCENCNCLNAYQTDGYDEDDAYDGGLIDEMERAKTGSYNNNDSPSPSAPATATGQFLCQLCGKIQQTSLKAKRRYFRNPRQYSEGDGRWKTFVMGLRELLDIEDKNDKITSSKHLKQRSSFKQHEKNISVMEQHHKDAESKKADEDIMDERMITEERIVRKDWICGYCRNRIPAGQLGDIETFKGRLSNHDVRVDEDDVDAIQQINPLLCPICYRVVSVRSRIIFIMEIISYYVFLFLLYPVVRVCLIPIYFVQAAYAWTNSGEDSGETSGEEVLFLKKHQKMSLEEQKKLREIEDLLPSDAPTRAVTNPSHQIWKILRRYQKKRSKIEINKDAKDAHKDAIQAKRKRQKEEEKEQRQKGKMIAQLGVLIDKYWKTRLAASEKHKIETKRQQTTLKEIEALKNELN